MDLATIEIEYAKNEDKKVYRLQFSSSKRTCGSIAIKNYITRLRKTLDENLEKQGIFLTSASPQDPIFLQLTIDCGEVVHKSFSYYLANDKTT